MMKTMGTVIIAPVIMALGLVILILGRIGVGDFSVSQWCLAIAAVLAAVLIIGTLLNFTIFAPIYWFFGRLRSNKSTTAHNAKR